MYTQMQVNIYIHQYKWIYVYTNTSEYMYTPIPVNICIHKYKWIYVYTNASEYMYTQKRMNINKCIYVYTNASEYMYTQMQVNRCIHEYLWIYVYTNASEYMYTQKQMNINKCIYVYTNASEYMYTRILVNRCIHQYKWIYVYTNTSEYMYTPIQVNICIHQYNWIYVYTKTNEYMYTQIQVNICIHQYKCIYVYTNTSEYMYMWFSVVGRVINRCSEYCLYELLLLETRQIHTGINVLKFIKVFYFLFWRSCDIPGNFLVHCTDCAGWKVLAWNLITWCSLEIILIAPFKFHDIPGTFWVGSRSWFGFGEHRLLHYKDFMVSPLNCILNCIFFSYLKEDLAFITFGNHRNIQCNIYFKVITPR